MKNFLKTPAARRTASSTLLAFFVTLLAPLFPQGRAEAQEASRIAYLLPMAAAEGIDQDIPLRVRNALSATLAEQRLTGRAGQTLALVPLSVRRPHPLVKQALEERAVAPEEIENPPSDLDGAIDFARRLGITTVLQGAVESFVEAGDRSSASIYVTLREYTVPADPATAVSPVLYATDDTVTADQIGSRQSHVLRDRLSERIAQKIASRLLNDPTLAPPDLSVPVEAPKAKKGPPSGLWIAVGAVAAVAAIFLLSSIGGSGKDTVGALAVGGVRAVSEENSVRVSWDPVANAVGYSVYRRVAGSQVVRSRSRNTAGYEALLNPQTNTLPTVVGGARSSFIDTTAQSGLIYEYAVTGVDEGGKTGPLSQPSTTARAGANIGTAPVLSGNAGSGFISLNWTASSSFVDGYIVFRRQGGVPNTGANSPDQLVQLGNVTRFDDTTVTNGQAYTYIVQPVSQVNVNQLLTGEDSNPVTFTATATAPPQAPRSVTASADASGRVFLSWQPSPESNVDFYEILRRRDRSRSRVDSGRGTWLRSLSPQMAPGGMDSRMQRVDPRSGRQLDLSNYTVIGTADSTVTTFTDGPLPDGTYTYAVRAVNQEGTRGDAAASAAVLVNAALAAPAGVRAVGLNQQVRLTWQPVAGDVEAYNIYRSQTPIGPSMTGPASAPGIALTGRVAGNVTTFIDTGLSNNVPYYYAVTSVDSQGAESDFGKGTATDTGALGIPHATPAAMTFTVAQQNLSANGMSTTAVQVRLTDAEGSPTAGVEVVLTTDGGRYVNLPAGASHVDAGGRQVQAVSDLAGEVNLALQSQVLTGTDQRVNVNLQARAAELPDAIELQSQTVAFIASTPNVIILNVANQQLPADNASTTNVAASVLDALGQPVPDGAFSVEFMLQSTNGAIRRSGNIQSFPFQVGPATISVPVVGGVATAIYQAGNEADPGPNVIPIHAEVSGQPAVAADTVITLVPGAPARIEFRQSGVRITSLQLAPSGNTTVQAVVLDAAGNELRSGTTVTFTVNPVGPVNVPGSGTTNANGSIDLQVSAGPDPAAAVVTARIGQTQVQSQLAVTVR